MCECGLSASFYPYEISDISANTISMNYLLCKEWSLSISSGYVWRSYNYSSGGPHADCDVICLQQITTFQENLVLARVQVRPAPDIMDIMDITREEVGRQDPAPDEAGRADWHVQ